MTVARASNVWTFAGTGASVGPFGVETPVYDVGHLSVGLVTTATGVFAPLTYGTDWSVSGIGAETGVTITLTAAHAVGTTLLIRIRPPLTQLVDIANLGRFNPADVERAFDLVVQTLQQFQTDLNRAIKVPEGETGFAATLASIAARASKLLGFNASGALDYLTNAPGGGSFLNLPIADTFVPGGKILWQSPAGAGGGTVLYSDVGEIQNAPYPTVTYATSKTLPTGDSGKVIKSTGQVTNIVYTLPAGATGLFYVIHCDSDTYTVNLDPNGSERISYGGANKSLTMLGRGWLVIQWDGGRWEITEDAGFYEIEA